MANRHILAQVAEDFNKARSRAFFSNILNILLPEKRELLSFYDVKSLIKPKAENYRGMQVISIDKIVGSEGRYLDFNKAFFPKKSHLRRRWERVDEAHLMNINLPPIKLYKIGEAYFVRDGNHRVSVASAQGVMAIDAEVIELTTEIQVSPGTTREELKRRVIAYERSRIMSETKLDTIIDTDKIIFTAPGRYHEMLNIILGHKEYMTQNEKREISFEEAVHSWYETLFKPAIDVIEKKNILSRFPKRTSADLFMWSIKHWNSLRKKRASIPLDEAVRDYSIRYGKNLLERIGKKAKQLFMSHPPKEDEEESP